MSNAAKVGILVGVLIFIVLFFKLIGGLFRFFLRHPIWFIILLAVGGIGLFFSVAVGGIVIAAVVGGGLIFTIMGGGD
ncbi:hypothetical protein FC56_GL001303 [Lentilactobacillus senioris DSM 24302 = JCM 17472]|uniref:Uncharacterized protein n=2 Tax=Lentilactobacillus senioris TaxID=931534 RepID=A0A0R2CRB2_9LACO|nr:hypothetical protein FC56_GL001303 [Lentilactobacillus senioris DSM 24302 = JCM 17472]